MGTEVCTPSSRECLEWYRPRAKLTASVYVGGRFVLGFGNSLAQMASPLLLTEICHPQHRGKVTAVYNCLWNLGALCKSLSLVVHIHR